MPALWAEKYAAWREQHPGADVTALKRPDGRYRMAVLGGEATEKHEYGCLLAIMPADVAEQARLIGASIDPGDLAEDGLELEPHITVLYGLHDESPEQVAHVLRNEGPVAVMLGETRCFKGEKSDVVYVAVESHGLHDANQLVADACPNTNKHPNYLPHLTIAYVQPGKGEKYCGMRHLDRWIVGVDKLIYSSPSKVRSTIPMGGVVRFSQRLSWEPYEGPRHGHGWRQSETGDVVYQTEKPGESKERPGREQIAKQASAQVGSRVKIGRHGSGTIVGHDESGFRKKPLVKLDSTGEVVPWTDTLHEAGDKDTYDEYNDKVDAINAEREAATKSFLESLPEAEIEGDSDGEQPSDDAVAWFAGASDHDKRNVIDWLGGKSNGMDKFAILRGAMRGNVPRPAGMSDEDYQEYSDDWQAIAKSFQKTLDSAPRYAGTVHRGVGVRRGGNTDFIRSLKPGAVIGLGADSSATKSAKTAEWFAKRAGVHHDPDAPDADLKVIFEVATKRGVDLSMKGANDREQEVVIRKGDYRIKGVGRSKDGNVIVKLEDADGGDHNPLTDSNA